MVTAQLLEEIDGIESNGEAVFVVAATNRLDLIDGAILSRFTEQIEIGLPGPEERLRLLQLFVGKTPFSQNGTSKIELLARLALESEGRSGRDLKNLSSKASWSPDLLLRIVRLALH
jgi:AAA+ superfamily predicted ATPase